MKYVKRSAEVLSAADRFETQLNWQLFIVEQEAVHAALAAEDGWVPGEPFYDRPRGSREGEQTIRYMIEEFDILEVRNFTGDGIISFLLRCEDCEVDWEDDGPCCWNCGAECELPKTPFSELYGRLVEPSIRPAPMMDEQLAVWVRETMIRNMNQRMDEIIRHCSGMTVSAQRASEALRRGFSQLSLHASYDIDFNRYRFQAVPPRDCPEVFSTIYDPLYISRETMLDWQIGSVIPEVLRPQPRRVEIVNESHEEISARRLAQLEEQAPPWHRIAQELNRPRTEQRRPRNH